MSNSPDILVTYFGDLWGRPALRNQKNMTKLSQIAQKEFAFLENLKVN